MFGGWPKVVSSIKLVEFDEEPKEPITWRFILWEYPKFSVRMKQSDILSSFLILVV